MKFLVAQLSAAFRHPQLRSNLAKLSRLVIILFSMIGIYAVLFHVIMEYEGQHHSWLTGVYWTLTVMSTLGFGDITFVSDLGRFFSIVVLVSGIFMLMIVLPFAFIRFFYAPWLEAQIRNRVPRAVPMGTKDHVLLCMVCPVALDLSEKLRLAKIPHYILERDPVAAANLHGEGLPMIAGDPESVTTWRALGAANARAVFANVSDAANTNIILTVRQEAPKIEVIAVAEHEDAIDILELSGASHVLPLKQRLGEHLANRVNAGHAEAHPIGRFKDLVIAEFPVHNTPLVGRTLRQVGLRQRLGINVVGVWERGRFEPAAPDKVLSSQSVPVVIGSADQLLELNTVLAIYDTNYSATLVLGGGVVGRSVARALQRREVKVHLIERDAGLAGQCAGVADRVIVGDATAREVLTDAGLESAPAVILTTNDDSTNIYLAIYCRRLNPELRIISRISHERNLEAIHRAGADFVLSYASLGAETAFSTIQGRGLMMFGAGVELFSMPVPAPLIGKTLDECAIGARTGLNVIAVQENGNIVPNPPISLPLPPASELLMIGSHEQRLLFMRELG
jgi:voltage-gated potassium channel